MPWGAVIGGAATIASGVLSGNAAGKAADAQTAASQAQLAQQKAQFDQIQQLLAPYSQVGTRAVGAQGDLLGLNGADKQGAAYQAIQNSPAFTSMLQQGQNSILQNASATGGLRGGNTQAALAQFSPQLLNQLIQQQFSQLGGLTSVGQNAAAGVGNAGMQTGNNITSILGQQGQIAAGADLAQGRVGAGIINGLGQIGGGMAGYNGFGGGGGSFTSPNMWGSYSNPTSGGGGVGIDQFGYLGGASTAGDYSDVRLKKNIRRIGRSDKGNTLYEWEWKAGGGKARGVIAQEVAHVPGAVHYDPSGFLKVNYDRV